MMASNVSDRNANDADAAVAASIPAPSTSTTSSSTSMLPPRAILGTMTFGGQTNEADTAAMMAAFATDERYQSIVRSDAMMDTAIMYQNGATQQLMGKILNRSSSSNISEGDDQTLPPTIKLATKANPFTKDKDLSPSGLRRQLEDSLRDLQTDAVDLFYLHAPDVNNPIGPTLETVQQLHQEGQFERFGLSNFTAAETKQIYEYMMQRNYVVPTVYQGMYNAITRVVEAELFPTLRECNGMAFYAYNPLAGGMLTGKYMPQATDKDAAKFNATVGNRFAGKSFWAQRYRQRYQQTEQFAAIRCVQEAIDDYNNDNNNDDQQTTTTINNDDDDGGGASSSSLTMAEVSLRWMAYHSLLKTDDGIIVGASSLDHFHANMTSIMAGPLPDAIVEAFDKASRLCAHVCPEYARGVSGSALPSAA